MEFRVLKAVQAGNILLESVEVEKPAVERPIKLFAGRKHAATIMETIASTNNPLYTARVAPSVDAKTLVGKTVETRTSGK